MDVEQQRTELEAQLQRMIAERDHWHAEMQKRRWRWPTNTFVIWFCWIGAAWFYVLGFIDNSSWFAGAIGLWFFSWSSIEDRNKERAEARRAARRAEWAEMERAITERWRIARIDYLMIPEWML